MNLPILKTRLSLSKIFLTLLTLSLLSTIASSLCQITYAQGVDLVDYMKRQDEDHNGILDQSEMGRQTKRYLKDKGFDTENQISVDAILAKIGKGKSDGGSQNGSNTNASNSTNRSSGGSVKVPGFGPSGESTAVHGFGLVDVNAATPKFSKNVERQIDDALERYDRNRDGTLDRREIERARWGSPRPEESDTNGDGKLSRVELANRYYAREQDSEKSDSGHRDDDDDKKNQRRGGDRSRGSWDDSRRNDSSSSRSTSSSERGSKSTSATGDRQKYAEYAQQLMKKYDEDSDGKLSADEVKKMRRPPVNADSDKDGFLTQEEVINSLNGSDSTSKSDSDRSSSKTSSKNSSSRSSSSSGSSRSSSGPRSSSSLGGKDGNGNQQIEMHEFSDDWNSETVEEFYEKDKNGDGVITIKEWNQK